LKQDGVKQAGIVAISTKLIADEIIKIAALLCIALDGRIHGSMPKIGG
jgi:hypothetical protein